MKRNLSESDQDLAIVRLSGFVADLIKIPPAKYLGNVPRYLAGGILVKSATNPDSI